MEPLSSTLEPWNPESQPWNPGTLEPWNPESQFGIQLGEASKHGLYLNNVGLSWELLKKARLSADDKRWVLLPVQGDYNRYLEICHYMKRLPASGSHGHFANASFRKPRRLTARRVLLLHVPLPGLCLGFAGVVLGFCWGFALGLVRVWMVFAWVLFGRVATSDQGGAAPHPRNLV